jgi:hypothetical protein
MSDPPRVSPNILSSRRSQSLTKRVRDRTCVDASGDQRGRFPYLARPGTEFLPGMSVITGNRWNHDIINHSCPPYLSGKESRKSGSAMKFEEF